MEEKNIRYKNFRYEHGLNSASLANALSGKNVSLVYAKSMADILGVEVSEIFNVKKEERYYAAPTIDKVKRAVRCVLAMAKRQRIVEHNFASADYISYGRKVQRTIECLDDKGAQQLFQAILNYDNIKARTAILLLLMTGMRRGELCGLEWQDIDLKKKNISIARAVGYCKAMGTYTKELKTESSNEDNQYFRNCSQSACGI